MTYVLKLDFFLVHQNAISQTAALIVFTVWILLKKVCNKKPPRRIGAVDDPISCLLKKFYQLDFFVLITLLYFIQYAPEVDNAFFHTWS